MKAYLFKLVAGSTLGLTPAAGLAQSLCISLDRFQVVEDAASAICPQALTLPRGENAADYVEEQARRRGLNREEKLLLTTPCISYGRGMRDG